MFATAIFTFTLAVFVTASPAKRGGLAQVITKCTVPNTVALTFDDGPSVYLKDVSDALTNAGAKGTFFINGKNYGCIYDNSPAKLVKYAYDAGHQIASHTWDHPHLTTLNRGQIDKEFERIEDAIQKIVGVVPAFSRPPYGEYNDLVSDVAKSRRQTLVNWDFDSGDSVGKSATQSEQMYDALIKEHPSTILALNHDVYEQTAHVVTPYAIAKLQKAGYKLVTVAECLGMNPYLSIGEPGVRDATWTC